MSPRRGFDFSFLQGVLAIRARAVARSKQPPPRLRTKRHDQATPSSRGASARLSLFGWQAHRQALNAPGKKTLDKAHTFFASAPLHFSNLEPSAPEMEMPAFSAPSFTNHSGVQACAPPLTPSTLEDFITSSYEPSAPMLTPTCLWTNVQWITPTSK